MNKKIKDALIAILLGACVAFLSSLIDGLSHLLQQYSGQLAAGGASAISYLFRTIPRA